jgi:hypothetical protein
MLDGDVPQEVGYLPIGAALMTLRSAKAIDNELLLDR